MAVESRTYREADSAAFLTTRERYGAFSNMHRDALDDGSRRYPTAEHYYQACKLTDAALVDRLCAIPNPVEAKRFVYAHRDAWREDWERVKVAAMRETLRLKARQHPAFVALLLATGDAPIVEISSRDDYWGAHRRPDGTLVGRNVLGRLLMELRAELRK